jgi:hypothetical protein
MVLHETEQKDLWREFPVPALMPVDGYETVPDYLIKWSDCPEATPLPFFAFAGEDDDDDIGEDDGFEDDFEEDDFEEDDEEEDDDDDEDDDFEDDDFDDDEDDDDDDFDYDEDAEYDDFDD